MKYLSALLLLISIFSATVICQTSESVARKGLNTFYLELAGSSFLYGINYEHSFLQKKGKSMITGKIGLSNGYLDGFYPLIPVGIGYDIGKNKSFFEINLTRVFDPAIDKFKNSTSIGIGYVRRPLNGFYFKGSVVLHFFDKEQPNWDGSISKLILPGIGFGCTF